MTEGALSSETWFEVPFRLRVVPVSISHSMAGTTRVRWTWHLELRTGRFVMCVRLSTREYVDTCVRVPKKNFSAFSPCFIQPCDFGFIWIPHFQVPERKTKVTVLEGLKRWIFFSHVRGCLRFYSFMQGVATHVPDTGVSYPSFFLFCFVFVVDSYPLVGTTHTNGAMVYDNREVTKQIFNFKFELLIFNFCCSISCNLNRPLMNRDLLIGQKAVGTRVVLKIWS